MVTQEIKSISYNHCVQLFLSEISITVFPDSSYIILIYHEYLLTSCTKKINEDDCLKWHFL
jgi:hypothetical protein